MRYAIIVSEKDTAGMNIKRRLLEMFKFEVEGDVFILQDGYAKDNEIKLYTLSKETIYSKDLDKEIKADVFIFTTRHKARSGTKTLTCHTPGNWNKAEFGGKDRELCVSFANLMKLSYLKLKENNDMDFYVSLECTHHGPFMEKPSMFIEIGSSEEEWKDEKAGKIVAKTIIDVVSSKLPEDKVCVGLGGTHYCDNFNKVLERTDISVGHVCPKHNIKDIDEEMIKKAVARNKEKVELVLLDWKGLGTEKQRVVNILDKLGLRYEKTTNLYK